MLDYDEKAEDAIDYEDIDEQYEGPEVQAASEEDYLLPKKAYLSTSLATLKPTTSVFDDENYDEEIEEEHEVVDNDSKAQTTIFLGRLGLVKIISFLSNFSTNCSLFIEVYYFFIWLLFHV